MRGSDKDINRLTAAGVLLIASMAVMMVGGLISEKRRGDIPEVEIIEAESVTTGTSAVSEDADDTDVGAASEISDTPVSEKLMININTADAEELVKLKGVGEKTAEKIIEYREQCPFESIEDIMNVSGIGEKKFEDIKDMICV
ncbi:MAG: helix-hairpin-helix domain-containing protein [Oscillospiraceae bacterium]|nr:helix-hairpin-helix domain-containing protein [Oscillospiraceae bacterium]